MADPIQRKQTWVDPKLTVFGDVNGLTLDKTPALVSDGHFFSGGPFHHVPIHS